MISERRTVDLSKACTSCAGCKMLELSFTSIFFQIQKTKSAFCARPKRSSGIKQRRNVPLPADGKFPSASSDLVIALPSKSLSDGRCWARFTGHEDFWGGTQPLSVLTASYQEHSSETGSKYLN